MDFFPQYKINETSEARLRILLEQLQELYINYVQSNQPIDEESVSLMGEFVAGLQIVLSSILAKHLCEITQIFIFENNKSDTPIDKQQLLELDAYKREQIIGQYMEYFREQVDRDIRMYYSEYMKEMATSLPDA